MIKWSLSDIPDWRVYRLSSPWRLTEAEASKVEEKKLSSQKTSRIESES